jgi:hypothetical protein
MKHSSHSRRRNIAPPPPKPRGGPGALAGGEEQAGQASLPVATTHALFAVKVQRKVSNGVAGLAAAGSSLDRQKSRQLEFRRLFERGVIKSRPPPEGYDVNEVRREYLRHLHRRVVHRLFGDNPTPGDLAILAPEFARL